MCLEAIGKVYRSPDRCLATILPDTGTACRCWSRLFPSARAHRPLSRSVDDEHTTSACTTPGTACARTRGTWWSVGSANWSVIVTVPWSACTVHRSGGRMRPITRSRVCPHLGSRDHRPVPPAASRQDHRILGGRNHKLGTSVRRVGQQADQFCGRDQSEQRYASGDYRHSVKLEIVDQLSGLAHGGIGVHGRDAGVDDIAHPAATHLARLAGWPPHRQGALGDHRDNSVAVADDSHRAVEVLQALPYLDHRILGGTTGTSRAITALTGTAPMSLLKSTGWPPASPR